MKFPQIPLARPPQIGEQGRKQMKSPAAISLEVRRWFGTEITRVALAHDLAGPHIQAVRRGPYTRQLACAFKQRALAARATGEAAIPLEKLAWLCRTAAAEVMRIRQIRHARAEGRLPVAAMRQLPAYQAYPQYLDEDPSLVLTAVVAALRRQSEAPDESS